MKYRIEYKEYYEDEDQIILGECLAESEAVYFRIENGFVSVWFEENKTQTPDFYVNAI